MRRPTEIELWSGVGMIGWGTWVHFDPRPLLEFAAYEPIARLPDDFWAGLTSLAGALQIALWWGGWGRPRVVAAFLGMLLFKVMAVSNMVSSEPGPASMVFCAMAFGNVAVVIRLVR